MAYPGAHDGDNNGGHDDWFLAANRGEYGVVEKELTTFEEDLESSMMISAMIVVAMVMMLSLINKAIAPVAQVLQAQAFQGKSDPREVKASAKLKWIDLIHDYPYTPWISAYFVNDGPYPVEVAINYPNDRFTLNPGETTVVNRSGAQERIAIIFFLCKEGETASVRVTGEY